MDDRIALRIDDIGASSKKYEIYSHSLYGAGNWLFLKYLKPFKKWGPYREMTASEWDVVFRLLKTYKAKLTVGVTACWVEDEKRFIPFPERFPEEAAEIKNGLQAGLIEIANHGLTHCVTANNAFKPRFFSENRTFHREFWEWISPEEQDDHLRRSQDILQTYFATPVVTFIPPGNVFSSITLELAGRYGLRYLSCNGLKDVKTTLTAIPNERVSAFHDRELVLHGTMWLEALLQEKRDRTFCFVKDLA